MSALFRRYMACTAPQQYYLCAANGFDGCCSIDPCSLPGCPDVSDHHTTAMTIFGTKVVSASSLAAAMSATDPTAPTTAQLGMPLPTSMSQQTSSDHLPSPQEQSTADATALHPTSSLIRATINGIVISAADIIPTSGGVIVLEPITNGLIPGKTSTFITTSHHLSTSTATIFHSSAVTKHTTSSASHSPANASSIATGHGPSTNAQHPVVGGAIGGAAVGALVIVAILLCCRRLKRAKRVKREEKEDLTVIDQRYVIRSG